MPHIIISISLFLISLFGFIIFLIYRFIKKKSHLKPAQYHQVPDGVSYEFVNLRNESFNQKMLFSEQTIEWQKGMGKIGTALIQNRVKDIVLVHGTFAGNDPLDIGIILKEFFPLGDHVTRKLIEKIKHKVLNDLGNFPPSYIELFQYGIGKSLPIKNFLWPSGNHHMARLRGAVDLINFLAKEKGPGERRLLIGHSHAGQLFALITQMLYFPSQRKQLFQVLSQFDFNIETIENNLSIIAKEKIDMVTLGTPPRYAWGRPEGFRLLHLINHRRDTIQAGRISGIITTRDGDYVQQFGIAGSDFPSPSRKENNFNKMLDPFLGVGFDLNHWRENIKYQRRLHDWGHHIFVDYGDYTRRPNFIKTILGHGCYTRGKVLRFNLETICQHFYSSKI